MTRYFANSLIIDTFPWVHIDEDENKIYVVSFNKASVDVEAAIWENYNQGQHQFIKSNADAVSIMNIDYIRDNLLTDVINVIDDPIPFTGAQIGAARANALFFFRETTFYVHNAAASLLPSG